VRQDDVRALRLGVLRTRRAHPIGRDALEQRAMMLAQPPTHGIVELMRRTYVVHVPMW
jgi:hypothetical protein